MEDSAQTEQVQLVTERIEHLWVGSCPWFQTSLFLCAQPLAGQAGSASGVLYDADGSVTNEISLSFPAGTVGVCELNQFLGANKLEAGIQHGHLMLKLSEGVRVVARINTNEGAAILGPARLASFNHGGFFPIMMCEERRNYVTFVNVNEGPVSLKCRLFAGSRAPECGITVPPRGSRVICIESEFPEFATVPSGKVQQGYIRIATKAHEPVGVQMLESTKIQRDQNAFSSVS